VRKKSNSVRFQKKVTVPCSLTTSSPPGPPGGWRGASERSTLLQDGRLTRICLCRWPQKSSRPNASTPACRPRLLRPPKAHDGRTSGGGSRVPLALAMVERQTAAPMAHRSPRPVVGRTLVRSTRQRSATTFSCAVSRPALQLVIRKRRRCGGVDTDYRWHTVIRPAGLCRKKGLDQSKKGGIKAGPTAAGLDP
jgi:hypothetical protein